MISVIPMNTALSKSIWKMGGIPEAVETNNGRKDTKKIESFGLR